MLKICLYLTILKAQLTVPGSIKAHCIDEESKGRQIFPMMIKN